MKSYLRAFQQFAWQRNALLMAILLLSSFGLKAQEKPNLWVSEPVVHNTLLAQNEEINLSFKVTNSGGQTAVGNLLRIYLSPDEVFSRWSDKIIYEENVGQLSAGASKVFDGLQVAPSASWESGTWYLFVVADYADFVDESFEGDNISSPVRLLVEDRQISSDKPDLLVSKLELQSDMITPNYAFNVSFNVTNVGTADMDQAVKHIVYLDEITDEGIVSERVSVHDQSFLAQGATQRLTRSFFVGAEKSGGNFRIRVEADAQQRLVEAREDNNSVSAPVAIKKVEQKQADLHFTDVSSLPDYVQAGSSFGFRSYLRNNGNADGTRFHHSYGLSTSPSRDDRIYSTTRGYYHSHLAAGSNYNRYISINVPDDLEEGIYYLVGVMDLEERIDETNEDNNTFSRQIYVKAKPKADLRVNNLSAEKTNLSQGETFRLNLEIENAGEGATGRDYWVFYDLVAEGRSNDGQDISSYDEREQRYSLAASAKDTYAWDVRVPQNLSPGRYKLIIKADAYDQVSEANESNNTRVIDVLVREAEPVKLPNLLLTNTSHNGPTMPGSLLSVNTTLLNNGEGDGDWNTKIKVYLSEDDKPGNDLNISGGGRSFNPMPAGYQQSTNLAVRIPATYSPGNYYIIVRADADKKEDESNEEDNIIVLPLNLMPAKIDLRPEIVSYPAQIGESSDIRVAVRVHNDGESSSSPVRLSYYLSQDKQIDDNDLEWAYAESSDIYAGSSDYISRDIWIGARDLWGTYYLLVKADYQDQIAETDETNNVAVSATTVEVVNSVADFRATAPTFNRSKVAFGETMVPFNYRVYNDGFRNATVNTKTYLSSTTNLNGESVLIYEENHYIAAGGSVTAYREFDVPSYVQAGNYYLLVVLDQNDQVEELDEDNNIIASATTMEVGAEDVFLEAKLHFSEYGQALIYPSKAADESLGINYTITNTGTTQAQTAYTLYLSDDKMADFGDTQIANDFYSLTGVNDGNNFEALYKLYSIPANETPGKKYVILKPSTNDQYPQTVAIDSFEVVTPAVDLTLELAADGRTDFTTGSTAEFKTVLKNLEAYANPNVFNIMYYYSTDNQLDVGDVRIGDDVYGNNFVQGNASVNLSQTVDFGKAGINLGAAYLLAKVDAGESNDETDETNNILAVPINILNYHAVNFPDQAVCDIMLLDPGYNGDYCKGGPFEDLVLSPATAGTVLEVEFLRFELEATDGLRVYDGPGSASPLLGDFSGNQLPPTLKATNAAGQLTFRFYTTANSTACFPGFEARISCVGPSAPLRMLSADQKNLSVTESSLENLAQAGLSLFPNPVTDVVNIKANNEWQEADYRLINSSGIILQEGTLEEAHQLLSVEPWPAGVYIIRLQKGDKIKYLRFIRR